MEFVRPDQLLTLVLFLGVLALAWAFVRLNKSGLGAKLREGKRISVSEVAALSPNDRAMIVKVDGNEFFVIKSKGVAAVLTPLPNAGEDA